MEIQLKIERAKQLREHISLQPEQNVNMDRWIGDTPWACQFKDVLEHLTPGKYDCDTSFCMAGHAAWLSDRAGLSAHIDWEISTVANRFLGVEDDLESDSLYLQGRWPFEVRYINGKEGVLARLDLRIKELEEKL